MKRRRHFLIANTILTSQTLPSLLVACRRIRADFDRASDIDDVLFKDFVQLEVQNPTPLSEEDEEIIVNAMNYRALEESEHRLPVGGRRNSLRPSVLVNDKTNNRFASKATSFLSNSQAFRKPSVQENATGSSPETVNSDLELGHSGHIQLSLSAAEQQEDDTRRAAMAFESSLLQTEWKRSKDAKIDAMSITGAEIYKRNGFDKKLMSQKWIKGVLTIGESELRRRLCWMTMYVADASIRTEPY